MPAYYLVEIDWDTSDVPGGGHGAPLFMATSASVLLENVSARVRQEPPLTATYGRDGSREYLPPAAGEMKFELDNPDGLYSSLNTNSPLFGKLNPGVRGRTTAFLHVYRVIILAQSPRAYYRLNGNGRDETSAFPGTFVGNPTLGADSALTTDSTDTSVRFNGAGQYMQAPGFSMPASAYTLEAWVRLAPPVVLGGDSTPMRIPRLLTIAGWNGSKGLCGSWSASSGAMLWVDATGFYTLVHNDTAGSSSLHTTISPSGIGTWDHVVGTWDGSMLRMYVNGEFVSSMAQTNAVGAGSGKFEIGTYDNGAAGTYLDGFIDEVAVYPTALSAEQVYRHCVYGRQFAFGPDHVLFDGYRDSPPELPGPDRRVVTERFYDGLAKLKSAVISTEELVGERIDVAVGKCLDAADWPASLRNITQARTTLERWCVDRIDAFTAIRDLTFTEGAGANFYIDPHTRKFTWEHRHYRLLTHRSITSRITVRQDFIEPVFGVSFMFDTGMRNVVTSCTVPINIYSIGASTVLWTGPTSLTLFPDQTRVLEVSTAFDWFTNAVTPSVGGGDYALSGTPLASVTLSRTSGKRAALTLVGGAGQCTITNLRMRAQPVSVTQKFETNTLSGASASGVDYGRRSFPSEFLPTWLPDVAEAQDFCNYIVSRYKDPVPTVRFSVNSLSDVRLAYVLPLSVSDRITVKEPSRAFIDNDFIIENITDVVGPRDFHQRIFNCEQSTAQQFWVLGDPILSVLGDSTKLGY